MKHVYRGVCERMQEPFGINSLNEFRLGRKSPGVCGLCSFTLHQKAWEGEEETGLQITDGSQPPSSTNPGKVPLLALSLQAHVWQCRSSTAITVGWFGEEVWFDSSPLCGPLPSVPCGRWHTAPPCAGCEPLQCYTSVGSCCPWGSAPALLMAISMGLG